MPNKPCISPKCWGLALPGSSRCADHEIDTPRAKRHQAARKAARASGNGAAARLRRAINHEGTGWCSQCVAWHVPTNLEIDHITPLAWGGTDTDENVQVLCKPHHRLKSIRENRTHP